MVVAGVGERDENLSGRSVATSRIPWAQKEYLRRPGKSYYSGMWQPSAMVVFAAQMLGLVRRARARGGISAPLILARSI